MALGGIPTQSVYTGKARRIDWTVLFRVQAGGRVVDGGWGGQIGAGGSIGEAKEGREKKKRYEII